MNSRSHSSFYQHEKLKKKIGYVRLLALRPFLAYCASPSDDNDDCGEVDGM
jgi:hypothetical protein